MSDLIDQANDKAELLRQSAENEARKGIFSIPEGAPGECVECGLVFTRVVDGYCGKCRDDLRRP